jgi:adenosylcobinamide kinase/adenosylcobinamide-phosphate guanylyltransferase
VLTLVLGGARSGKSRHAQSLAAAASGPVVFVATAAPVSPDEDPEMAAKIALDRAERERRIVGEVEALATALREREAIVVTNEVGEGIVPETPLAREFRDLQGQANQLLAREASRVVFLIAGIPMTVKG